MGGTELKTLAETSKGITVPERVYIILRKRPLVADTLWFEAGRV